MTRRNFAIMESVIQESVMIGKKRVRPSDEKSKPTSSSSSSGEKPPPRDKEAFRAKFGRRVFCICQTPIDPDGCYIRCNLGKPINCNGWVHLQCAGLSAYIEPSERGTYFLRQKTDFLCDKCHIFLHNKEKEEKD